MALEPLGLSGYPEEGLTLGARKPRPGVAIKLARGMMARPGMPPKARPGLPGVKARMLKRQNLSTVNRFMKMKRNPLVPVGIGSSPDEMQGLYASEYALQEDGGIGKFSLKKVFKGAKKLTIAKVATAPVKFVAPKLAKKIEKQATSAFRVTRGAVGFTKGLSAGELKKAKLARKVGVAVIGIATAVVGGPFIMAGVQSAVGGAGSLAGSILSKVGGGILSGASKLAGVSVQSLTGVLTSVNKARALAGYPPLSANEIARRAKRKGKKPGQTDEQFMQEVAQESAQVMDGGGPEAEAMKQEAMGEQTEVNDAVVNAGADPTGKTPAPAEPGVGEFAEEVPEKGMSTQKMALIGGGVVVGLTALYLLTKKK